MILLLIISFFLLELYQLNYECHNDYIILHCLSSVDVNPPSSSISKLSNLDLILLSSSVECKKWWSFSSEAILDFLVFYRSEVIWITACLVISVCYFSISAIFAHFVAISLLVPLHSITVITMNNYVKTTNNSDFFFIQKSCIILLCFLEI